MLHVKYVKNVSDFYYEGKMFFFFFFFFFLFFFASVLLIIASLCRDVLEIRVGGKDSAEAARLLRDDKTAPVSFLIYRARKQKWSH